MLENCWNHTQSFEQHKSGRVNLWTVEEEKSSMGEARIYP